ncbi:MAG: hypothetical protein P8181_09015 [bacterium]
MTGAVRHFPVMLFLVSTITAVGACGSCASEPGANKESAVDLLSSLPTDLQADDAVPLEYHVTSTFYNRLANGTLRSKAQITAEFTRSAEDGDVNCRWNDVRVAAPANPEDQFQPGTVLDFMEDFSYAMSEGIIGEELYSDIPDGDLKHLLKTLVWDAAMLEPVFWDHFDELRLNEDFVIPDFEDFSIAMGNWGVLRMKNLKMRWMGISKVNGETCALLGYRSLANPVQYGAMAGTNGRSLYWGSICVSLEDKQVEYATMIEDVFLEMPVPGESAPRAMNLQREVTFEHMP